MRRDDRVAIIQHPGGHLKKISVQNNFVAYADANLFKLWSDRPITPPLQ